MLDAFAAQLALFVNKERALQESREAQVAQQSQKLQKVLFDSVSHELKTPLAAMTAALQQPRPNSAELQQAARRLTHTVDHLLDATRLESGLLQPVREWCDPGELVHEAVAASRIERRRHANQHREEPTGDLRGLSADSAGAECIALERDELWPKAIGRLK